MKPSGMGGLSPLPLLFLAIGLLAGCAAERSLTHGTDLVTEGRWEEAVQFYQEAARSDPRNVEVRLGLARSMHFAAEELTQAGTELEKADRLDEAAAAYRRALTYNAAQSAALGGLDRLGRAKQIQERLDKARERMEAKELRAAQAEVNAALRLVPDHATAKALKREIAAQLAVEAAAAKADPDSERLVGDLFSAVPVSLRFRDTDIKEVLEVFAKTSGVNIFTDEAIQPKRVTTFFKALSLREAFTLILSSNRLFAKKVAANTVIVAPDNPGKRQQYDELTVQTFYLTDADAKVVVNLLRTILNTRQIFVNEKLNALVIRDTPEKVELARKLLEANDRSVGEVEIDLEVLEVDRNSLQNLGIDISPRSYMVTLGLPAVIPFATFGATLAAGSALLIPASSNPSLILNLVKSDGHTKIMASPTVRILDRQKARLLIGERRPFLISSIASSNVGTGTSTGGTTTPTVGTTTETRVEYRDLGLKLTLTPIIHLNGEVTVELNFEISAAGAPISGVTSGELLPPVNTRNLDTFIKVKNGETRLLGGLYQETESLTATPIPGLSDLPYLGRLFGSKKQERTRTDVLISITPRLVKALERPDAEIESFVSGTADSFGPSVPIPSGGPIAPTPQAVPPRPAGPPQQTVPQPTPATPTAPRPGAL
jgi:general secretion pathway protein D